MIINLKTHQNKSLNRYLTKLDLCSTQPEEVIEKSGLFYRPKMFRLDPEKASDIQVRDLNQILITPACISYAYRMQHMLPPQIPKIVVIEGLPETSNKTAEFKRLNCGVVRNGNYFGFYMRQVFKLIH